VPFSFHAIRYSMKLPERLLRAIEAETEQFEGKVLARAAAELSARYQREDFSSPVLTSDAHRAAYLAVRLPATFAANAGVLEEIKHLAADVEIASMLDLGAGPGTALFAAKETFPELGYATLLESDPSWLKMGERLAEHFDPAIEVTWTQSDLRRPLMVEEHDLVIMSYVLGELPQGAIESIVRSAWKLARKFLVIVEPGTTRGFATINEIRSTLIAAGIAILAPCPHHNVCPMAVAGDWCHFAQRVERTSLHRQLKGGELGFEDEKFSYVVAAREPRSTPAARIVRHPRKHSGHVQLTLCTAEGLKQTTVTKSQKSLYREARKAGWGDGWGVPSTE
jgi:ribosomal protein RSM22 (predicted rRNA methylase)